MKLTDSTWQRKQRQSAFTVAEALVAAVLVGLSWISLGAAIGMSLSLAQANREDLRATQIMVQKMEQFRLYNWAQVNDAAYVPQNFQEYFDPAHKKGPQYSGTVNVVANPPSLPANYQGKVVSVTVSVSWTSYNGGHAIPHTRTMQTYVAQYGMNTYTALVK